MSRYCTVLLSVLVWSAPMFCLAQAVGADGLTFAELDQALQSLKAAVAADQPAQVAHLLSFPVRVQAEGTTRAVWRAQFIALYRQIFTPAIKKTLAAQDSTKMLRDVGGAAVHDGEIRFRKVCEDVSCSRHRALVFEVRVP